MEPESQCSLRHCSCGGIIGEESRHLIPPRISEGRWPATPCPTEKSRKRCQHSSCELHAADSSCKLCHCHHRQGLISTSSLGSLQGPSHRPRKPHATILFGAALLRMRGLYKKFIYAYHVTFLIASSSCTCCYSGNGMARYLETSQRP